VYRILKAEMVRANISIKQLSMKLDITERSLRNKINGVTEFTLSESLRINEVMNEKTKLNISLEDLFER
jgi:transcriptional antiterminator